MASKRKRFALCFADCSKFSNLVVINYYELGVVLTPELQGEHLSGNILLASCGYNDILSQELIDAPSCCSTILLKCFTIV